MYSMSFSCRSCFFLRFCCCWVPAVPVALDISLLLHSQLTFPQCEHRSPNGVSSLLLAIVMWRLCLKFPVRILQRDGWNYYTTNFYQSLEKQSSVVQSNTQPVRKAIYRTRSWYNMKYRRDDDGRRSDGRIPNDDCRSVVTEFFFENCFSYT